MSQDRRITALIEDLLIFGFYHGLYEKDDRIYIRNALYDLFHVDYTVIADFHLTSSDNLPEIGTVKSEETVGCILEPMLDYAFQTGLIIENTITYRDLFSARIMGLFMARPSEIERNFQSLYKQLPKSATDWFFELCRMCNYIQVDRNSLNCYWLAETEYGDMEVTINLSKPEKDPAEIAAARSFPQTGYPPCELCIENVGFAGHLNHSARQNLRIIPIKLNNENWYFQYSPYSYYNEHCIVLNKAHVPMQINENTFLRLLDFIEQFPHYFLGSNADLPIVGGSILSHDHFQGGCHVFPMEKAESYAFYQHPDYENIEVSLINWPMTVIRLVGRSDLLMYNSDTKIKMIGLATDILKHWRGYGDESVGILAFSKSEKDNGLTAHNTITPIVRYNKLGLPEMDLVLRNNRTTDEHPLGIFHPHSNLHHIKKENIGLIEVMGLAILPGRLAHELDDMAKYLSGEPIAEIEAALAQSGDSPYSHTEWLRQILVKAGRGNTFAEAEGILKSEVGHAFKEVLLDAGVFKKDDAGKASLERFMEACGFQCIPFKSAEQLLRRN